MFLGIDIAKLKFDVALLTEDDRLKHKVFANSPAGLEQLSAWLTHQLHLSAPLAELSGLHACLKATGAYGEALASFLHERGHRVSVVNPAAISAFVKGRLSRTKTDKADATLIARFCQRMQPIAWEPPAVEISELQALTRSLFL